MIPGEHASVTYQEGREEGDVAVVACDSGYTTDNGTTEQGTALHRTYLPSRALVQRQQHRSTDLSNDNCNWPLLYFLP